MEDRTLLASFLVINTVDSGPGSLRQAILDSDANPGSNIIDFNIPGQGVQTIGPESPLPPITTSVLIVGFSQPGYAGTPLIQLSGQSAGSSDGLTLTSSGTTVRGLAINGFTSGAGILITGPSAFDDSIYGNFLGTDVTGTTYGAPNDSGVKISGGAHDNIIGAQGDAGSDSERNLLSGNTFAGVWISGQGTDRNVIDGNYIGTDVTGTVALPNGDFLTIQGDSNGITSAGGVVIDSGASSNRIGIAGDGATDASERNVISGNNGDGIDLVGQGTSLNVIAGNLIGTDVSGKNPLGNAGSGILLYNGASSNWIGTNPSGAINDPNEGNVIASNSPFLGVVDKISGVRLYGNGTDSNVVAGNDIGTDTSGVAALPNSGPGIDIEHGASNNTIGGTAEFAGNLITNNNGPGVDVVGDNSLGNSIPGNSIFANEGPAIDLGGDGITFNSTAPRQGPNDFQNYPIIVPNADGQLQGCLGGSTPNTTFQIEFFASAGFGPTGSGEAEQYLGSVDVTTDSQGQAVFDVPYTPPADKPIVTATATDPQGNTSELSPQRPTSLEAPTTSLPLVPGNPLTFTTASGTAIALSDPDTGPLDPSWDLTLSVSAGTLSLSTEDGLAGSGDGTGTLHYEGDLSALNAALEGLVLTPPASLNSVTLNVDAQADGAAPIQARLVYSQDLFQVTTTADSGPGSLRQAILDSNASPGANIITFDIPGPGVQTIAPESPLPPITASVLIDGFSQPGYASTPLIELSGQFMQSGNGLDVTGSGTEVRGLAINGFASGAGILINGASATNTWVYGDFIGTDPTGTQASPNNTGVEVSGGAHDNIIGAQGDAGSESERNLLSGNTFAGVWITGQGTDRNIVDGNFIGTDVSGTLALANGDASTAQADSNGITITGGVVIDSGASSNRIGIAGDGVTDAGDRNVISGNNGDGIDLVGQGTSLNLVAGDLIGTDVSGKNPLGNSVRGVLMYSGAASNWIGTKPSGATTDPNEGNVIGGNGLAGGSALGGVVIDGAGTDGNVVSGNAIGTDTSGVAFLPNFDTGVSIESGSSDNTIGGTAEFAGNLITEDDDGACIEVGDSSGDTTVGNWITGNRIFGIGTFGQTFVQTIVLGGSSFNLNPTYNSTTPRQGPNLFQNYPVIAPGIDGQFQGWLGGCTPDTEYDVEFFASAGFTDFGWGQAEQYLGSLEVATNGQGQAIFNVPYNPPADMPIVTATATDPQGNTSEISTERWASLEAPTPGVRIVPGRPMIFSATSGNGIVLNDVDAGPLDPVWDLTLSVGAGTLTLSGTTGLVGTGDGSGTLHYQGALSSLNAALEGLRYTPPQGYQGSTELTVNAQSTGASPVQAQITIDATDGIFRVTTTADSGPGSLRQAIIDSNAATGGGNTIDFAIPATGVQTIALASPLPPITDSVLIDGFSQPGYAGAPLIELAARSSGFFDGLTIISPSVTVRGLQTSGLAAGNSDFYQIDTATDEWLVARVHAAGPAAGLTLLDSQGHVLLQSDGQSAQNHDNLIDMHIPAGSSSLEVERPGGEGSYTLSTALTPAAPPLQPVPDSVGVQAIVVGDFNGDGHADLATSGSDGTLSLLLGNGDGSFQQPVLYDVGSDLTSIVAGDFNGDGHLDLAVTDSGSNDVSVLLGNGDGSFQQPVQYAVGLSPASIVAGDFNGDGHLDLAVAYSGSNDVSVLLGNGDGTFQSQVTYAVGSIRVALVTGDYNGDGRTDLAVANEWDGDVSV